MIDNQECTTLRPVRCHDLLPRNSPPLRTWVFLTRPREEYLLRPSFQHASLITADDLNGERPWVAYRAEG